MGILNTNLFRLRNFCNYCQEIGLSATLALLRQRAKRRDIFELRVKGIPTPVYCRANGSDFDALRQVIGRQDVAIQFDRPPGLIIDGGANVGYASLVLTLRYPTAKVVAIEPDKNNCEIFRKNCSGYSNVQLLEGALWPCAAPVAIVNPKAEAWAFQVAETGASDAACVRGYAIPEIMEMFGADRVGLLKLDIEGAEKILFTRGAGEWLRRVDVMVVELHDYLVPGCSAALARLLEGVAHTRDVRGEYDCVWISH